jgi:phospho-N-acetylmuramoyl-pentapeptide-transferase
VIGILIASAVALLLALLLTPLVIRALKVRGWGQFVREDGPQAHFSKGGTPTMGGLMIIGVALLGYFLAHVRPTGLLPFTSSGLLAIGAIVAMALLGFVDDYLKVSRRRSLGLNSTGKIGGQLVIAIGFGYLAMEHSQASTDVSFARPLGINLGLIFLIWVFVIFSAASNGVNFADGLDGLACGSAAAVMGAYVVVTFWQFRHSCSPALLPGCYDAPHSADLSMVAASMFGAAAGFLWWNAAPAKIFMGDTGSLAIGGGMASLAILTNTHLLLIVLGGLYVVETMSVVLQVVAYKVFGRRVFLMAPIHHHFELAGWPEFTVIVRFWILAALGVAFGLGLFYAEFLGAGGIE